MANTYRAWVDGEVLTAANVTEYLQKGTVISCDTSANYPNAYAREGMTIYDRSLDCQLVYNGSAWVRTVPVTTTAVQTYSPSWLQGVAVTGTVNENRYIRTGPVVEAWVSLTATGAGTNGSEITVSLPVAPSGNFVGSVIGEFAWQDDTTNLWVTGVALMSTGSKANFVGGSGATGAFGSTFGLGIGDVFRLHVRYTV